MEKTWGREGRFCSWRKKYTECKYVCQCKSTAAPSLSFSLTHFSSSFDVRVLHLTLLVLHLTDEMAQKTIDKAKKMAQGVKGGVGWGRLKTGKVYVAKFTKNEMEML